MPRRGERGFTLLELGVVLGVAAVLLTGIAVLGGGRLEAARGERVATELRSYARIGAGAWARGVEMQPNPPNLPVYSYQGTQLQPNTGLCFDLSLGGDRLCGTRDPRPGADPWPGALPPPPSMLSMLPGGAAESRGFNPYCGSYVICLFSHRVEARTCVPAGSARQAMASGTPCHDACPLLPGRSEPPVCVATSVSPRSWKGSRMQFTIDESWTTGLSDADEWRFLGH